MTETIRVEQGQLLSLQFTAFDILKYSWESTCNYDHLTIMDGDGTTLMEKSCGSSLPASITSTSNVVKLVFSTDDWNAGTADWSVSWSAVTPGECQQHVWIFLDDLSNCLFLPIMVAIALGSSHRSCCSFLKSSVSSFHH